MFVSFRMAVKIVISGVFRGDTCVMNGLKEASELNYNTETSKVGEHVMADLARAPCVHRKIGHTDYTYKTDAHGKVRANPQHPRNPRAIPV